jgi:hypothetical protein
MTPKQRQAIRDRQNARNMKPEQKEARRDQYKAHRELRRNTLRKDSIAMVNPRYNPMDDSTYDIFEGKRKKLDNIVSSGTKVHMVNF